MNQSHTQPTKYYEENVSLVWIVKQTDDITITDPCINHAYKF